MSQPNQPVHVQEKTPKPQGLLPKNVQSWLLIGLAFLMVAIMWLTGGKKPPVPAKSASSVAPVQAPLEVNETKIAEMQNRIQDLQRQQLLAQTALAQQTRQLGAAAHDSPQSTAWCRWSGRTAPGRRPDPSRAEEARLPVTVLIECRTELSQTSSEHAGRGNRNTPPRSGPAPFEP